VDNNHVKTIVDGEEETFSRADEYSQLPGSGFAHFGPVMGDWRMIRAIAEDMEAVFKILPTA
jgi:hypothetical protein